MASMIHCDNSHVCHNVAITLQHPTGKDWVTITVKGITGVGRITYALNATRGSYRG